MIKYFHLLFWVAKVKEFTILITWKLSLYYHIRLRLHSKDLTRPGTRSWTSRSLATWWPRGRTAARGRAGGRGPSRRQGTPRQSAVSQTKISGHQTRASNVILIVRCEIFANLCPLFEALHETLPRAVSDVLKFRIKRKYLWTLQY